MQCDDPRVCAAGNFSPLGGGQNGGGDKACQQCPPGKFQTATGSSSSFYLHLTVVTLTKRVNDSHGLPVARRCFHPDDMGALLICVLITPHVCVYYYLPHVHTSG